MTRVGITGTTSWGTTLAIVLSKLGVPVQIWARTESEASRLREDGENARLLPGARFPDSIGITSSPREAFIEADIVIVAVPSASMRDNLQVIRDSISTSATVVSATKGLEMSSGKRMSEVMKEELPSNLSDRICALSGPNLAQEIIDSKPSSTVVASNNQESSYIVQNILNSSFLRVYTNSDIIGVELGGALKNIIALGAGICDGINIGSNAKAAFMTRGLAEISRLAVSCGAKPLTLAGLAGMGDLIATCSSPLSRNYSVGTKLASGRKLEDIIADMKHVAEGVDTTVAAIKMADATGVDMPITRATHDVLFNNMDISEAVINLMERTPSPELIG